MQCGSIVSPCDVAIVGGSIDRTVPLYVADLYHRGLVHTIVFSGGLGRNTENVFDVGEAELYQQIACAQGVPKDVVYLETVATNTGENISLSMKLIEEKSLHHDRILLIHKPYMERRFVATFEQQFPHLLDRVQVTSCGYSFDEYVVSGDIGFDREGLIHMLVGDMQRIYLYAARGYQSIQSVPDQVEQAYQYLLNEGYVDCVVSV